jgi:phosphoglucosamine mutase
MTLFGTDGVRGPAGRGPLSPIAVTRLAYAFAQTVDGPVAVARDTRRSGPMILGAVVSGLTAAGADVHDLGVLPTPALAWYLSCHEGLGGGLMITASHNAWPDNGVKFFAADGTKITDATQDACEAAYAALVAGAPLEGEPAGVQDVHFDARRGYLESFGRSMALEGKTLVLDHASGAAHQILGPALKASGAMTLPFAPVPDGCNINEGTGAVHPDAAAERVVSTSAWGGVVLDGDGDRIAIVDEQGTVHDGDAIVGFLAAQWQAEGRLIGDTVVGTVTTNGGLEAFLQERKLKLERTPVGDRHVSAAMVRLNANLGGESSGHVLTPELCPSGDATRVALEVLRRAATLDRPLSELLGAVPRYPSANRKVAAGHKPPLEGLSTLQSVVAAAEAELAAVGGRSLLRYSGTEPVLRIQVEASESDLVEAWADRLAAAAVEAIATDAST